jgi:hypothetical protein
VVGSCASAEGINEQMQGDDGTVSCVFIHYTGISSSFTCLEACFGGFQRSSFDLRLNFLLSHASIVTCSLANLLSAGNFRHDHSCDYTYSVALEDGA